MDIDLFLSRWTTAPASERANSQPFLLELCALLEVPKPATGNTGSYCFERVVKRHHADGSPRSDGRIDLYKQGCFVLESKQKTEKERQNSKAFDTGMIAAKQQAEDYAKFLDEWPPFLVVVDVGHSIELFADFSGTGKRYLPFSQHKAFTGHRLQLQQLREPKVRALLAKIWTDARSLDPSLVSQQVTRRVAEKLAKISTSLEDAGHDAEAVASFLMRCIFTMFAEDVRLLPPRSFEKKLEHWKSHPEKFAGQLQKLWAEMNVGGDSLAFDDKILRFNGGLFTNTHAFVLNAMQIGWLHEAAVQDWTEVEPAIFGTLLERALNPTERHALGAHFTPRAYVERLVFPTVIEPLREDWDRVKVAVMARLGRLETLKTDDARKKAKEAARKELLAFHHTLCSTRVLDPACGTGNFLYVAMEHMKRLEGEVLDLLAQIEGTQRLALLSSSSADGSGPRETVDPHQFLGIEVNGRAAVIAELVLWIGYLQWHYRTFLAASGTTAQWHEPVLRQFGNIEHRDAILEWDGDPELVHDEHGKPVRRWDGVSTKKHPVTGDDVPDETKTKPLFRYTNPRKASWPQADFVVGNPPFLGKLRLIADLGEGYVSALREVYADETPGGADLVMHWWAIAGRLAATGNIRRFGFVTTNSITQAFNRRVVNEVMTLGVGLLMAIPDHPWVESTGGAAVRIAMTVGERGAMTGVLSNADDERVEGDIVDVTFKIRVGRINSDLTVGADVASAKSLSANAGLASMGPMVGSRGFVVDDATRAQLVLSAAAAVVAPLRNGKDLVDRARGLFVIDVDALSEDQVREQHPAIYQHLLLRVRPERAANRDARLAREWWRFRRSNAAWRALRAGLTEVVVTVETAKHRVFFVLPQPTIAEHGTITFGFSDRALVAVMSSRIHESWALAAGGRLGVGNDPRYNKTRCFDPFPFPVLSDAQRTKLRALGEALDAHRKTQQAKHPGLTITGMYNVLASLRAGEPLSDKEKLIHEQGLVSILKQVHDDIDDAVFDAYGWPKDLDDEGILERLVALNHERAAEERRGLIRWLRPEYQLPLLQQSASTQLAPADDVDLGADDGTDGGDDDDVVAPSKTTAVATTKAQKKQAWPEHWPDRVAAVARSLRASGGATVEGLAAGFSKAKLAEVEDILEALREYGQVEQVDHEHFVAVG